MTLFFINIRFNFNANLLLCFHSFFFMFRQGLKYLNKLAEILFVLYVFPFCVKISIVLVTPSSSILAQWSSSSSYWCLWKQFILYYNFHLTVCKYHCYHLLGTYDPKYQISAVWDIRHKKRGIWYSKCFRNKYVYA